MKKIILITTCVFGLNSSANASLFQILQNNINGILGINYNTDFDDKKDGGDRSILEHVNLNSNITKNKEDGKFENIDNYINGDNNYIEIFKNNNVKISNYINGNNNQVSIFEDNQNNCEKKVFSCCNFMKEKITSLNSAVDVIDYGIHTFKDISKIFGKKI